MIYAQFYHRGVMSKQLIEACGDRSVIILDGRQRRDTHHAIAKSEQERRGYEAYRLMSGDTFTRSAPITDVIV